MEIISNRIPPKYSISINQFLPELWILITMRSNQSPFFICFPPYCSKERESRSAIMWRRIFHWKRHRHSGCPKKRGTTHNIRKSCWHWAIRGHLLFFRFLGILFMLYQLTSCHGSSMKNRWVLLLLFQIRRSDYRRNPFDHLLTAESITSLEC